MLQLLNFFFKEKNSFEVSFSAKILKQNNSKDFQTKLKSVRVKKIGLLDSIYSFTFI